MVQLLWEMIWQFLTKLNVVLPYSPAVTFLGIHPIVLNTRVHTKTCAGRFIAGLFIPKPEATEMSFSGMPPSVISSPVYSMSHVPPTTFRRGFLPGRGVSTGASQAGVAHVGEWEASGRWSRRWWPASAAPA